MILFFFTEIAELKYLFNKSIKNAYFINIGYHISSSTCKTIVSVRHLIHYTAYLFPFQCCNNVLTPLLRSLNDFYP